MAVMTKIERQLPRKKRITVVSVDAVELPAQIDADRYAGIDDHLLQRIQAVRGRLLAFPFFAVTGVQNAFADEVGLEPFNISQTRYDLVRSLPHTLERHGIIETDVRFDKGKKLRAVDEDNLDRLIVIDVAHELDSYGIINPSDLVERAIKLVGTNTRLKAPFEAFLDRKRRERLHIVTPAARRQPA